MFDAGIKFKVHAEVLDFKFRHCNSETHSFKEITKKKL